METVGLFKKMKSMASFSRSKERGLKEGLVEIEKRRRELGPRRDIDKKISLRSEGTKYIFDGVAIYFQGRS